MIRALNPAQNPSANRVLADKTIVVHKLYAAFFNKIWVSLYEFNPPNPLIWTKLRKSCRFFHFFHFTVTYRP